MMVIVHGGVYEHERPSYENTHEQHKEHSMPINLPIIRKHQSYYPSFRQIKKKLLKTHYQQVNSTHLFT